MKSFKDWDKYDKIAFLVILIAGVLRISLALFHHVSGDACWQLSNALYIAQNHEIPLHEMFGRTEPFWAPPFFHFVVAFFYNIFSVFGGNAALVLIKLVSPLFGISFLVFSYLIGKELFNGKVALYALLFLAVIPVQFDYSIFSYVDGVVGALAVASVYFMLKDRYVISAILAGLTILTKYNGIFILPVLLFIFYYKRESMKDIWKKLAAFCIVSGALGSLWFLRNLVYLGNPVWPFMNSLFHGYSVPSFVDANVGFVDFGKIISLEGIISLYLGFFGVPDGNIAALKFVSIPFISIMLGIWLILTVVFIIPFVLGVFEKNKKHTALFSIWVSSFIVLILFYIINASWSVSRFLLPAFPAIALWWALGFDRLMQRKEKIVYVLAFAGIGLMFILGTIMKLWIASNAWSVYEADFVWIKENTNRDDLLLTNSQCVSFNTLRQTLPGYPENILNADYIWINQDFGIDQTGIYEKEFMDEVGRHSFETVYNNPTTKTTIVKPLAK